jgi:MFS family permease
MKLGALRQRNFALLWFSGLISMTGTWALYVAMPIAVYELTRSAVATSAVAAVNLGVRLVVGPIAGVYVDRWDRRQVMVYANLLLALVLVPALLVTSADRVWILFPVTGLTALLSQLVSPAEHALLPRLVPEEQLAAANALNGLNNNLARLIGPAVGGVAAAVYGLRGAVLLDLVSFVLCAGLVALISGRHRAERTGDTTGIRREIVDGARAIRRSALLRALFVALAFISIGEGVLSGLFPVYVGDALGGGALELGWMMSAQAVGGLVGGVAATWFALRWAPVRMMIIGLLCSGALDLVIFNLPRFVRGPGALIPVLVLFVIVGVPIAVLTAGAMTLLQTEVVDEMRGRVFGFVMVVQSGVMLLGTGIAAVATEPLGALNVLILQGGCGVLAGVAFGVMARRARVARTPGPVPAEPPAALAETGSR